MNARTIVSGLSSDPTTSRLALATGVIGVASGVSLALLYTVGGPFGLINDLGNAALGISSAVLLARIPPPSNARNAAAAAGAALSVAGTALVVSRTTGWYFAGLVSGAGLACIGLALVGAVRTDSARSWPAGVRRLGMTAGLLMATGFANLPAMAMGFDDAATVPWWAWIGSISWVGTLAFLGWAFWLARTLALPPRRLASAPR